MVRQSSISISYALPRFMREAALPSSIQAKIGNIVVQEFTRERVNSIRIGKGVKEGSGSGLRFLLL